MSWMITASGRRVDLIAPDPSTIKVVDIFDALARLCRFNGHCKRFYSVAEHCLIGAQALRTKKQKLAFLLHDATEAYIGDITSPLKSLLPDYVLIERQLESVIRDRYQLWDANVDRIVKHMDLRMLATEKRDLMPRCEKWPCLVGIPPLKDRIPHRAPKEQDLIARMRSLFYLCGGTEPASEQLPSEVREHA